MIQTLQASTAAYLNFLRQQQANTQGDKVADIHQGDPPEVLVDGELHYHYVGTMQPYLRLSPDQSATLRLAAGSFEIRILSYHSKRGELTFASRQLINEPVGHLVIDFTWLVERVLNWLRNRGMALLAPEDLPVPQVGGPITFPPDTSEENRQAATQMLNGSLSYVWGPPGTGKTSHVLAPTAAHLVGMNRRVLVVASTNLAVDNALDAIIPKLPSPGAALRMGTPSEAFIKRWPQCCEVKLFARQQAALAQQVAALEATLSSLKGQSSRIHELNEIIRQNQPLRTALDEQQQIKQRRANEVSDEATAALASLHCCMEVLAQLRSQAGALLQQQQDLQLPELEAQVASLESDHAAIITSLGENERAIRSLCWYHRFTSAPATLRVAYEALIERRKVVEGTLLGRRGMLDKARLTKQGLEAELLPLQDELHHHEIELPALRSRSESLSNAMHALAEEASALEARCNHVTKTVTSAEQESLALPSEATLLRQMVEAETELAELRPALALYQLELSSKLLLGMTLDGFIGMTLNQGTLAFEHVFVDEAAYAPLAKVIPLLSLNCPISLLGDHRQLPPICQNQNDPLMRAFWAKSAIFLADAWSFGTDYEGLNQLSDPTLRGINQLVLTRSYRFGPSLANILNEHVYDGIGLKGMRANTHIETIHCSALVVRGQENRQSHTEVEQIVRWAIEWLNQPDNNLKTLAILTPYKAQMSLISLELRNALGAQGRQIEVLNVHKAQGREWDTVLFSVIDTDAVPNRSPWFTDDLNPQGNGREVLNTALSRAKERLAIFLDAYSWARRPELLLGKLVAQFPPC